jgi:hypothetical protein
MNWLRALALVTALLASGCGSGSAAHLVHTHGTLDRIGGPAPGAPLRMKGIRVRFHSADESVTIRTDRHGRFAFDAAPGTYGVSIRTGGLPPVPTPDVIHVPHAGPLRLVVSIR